MATQMQLQAFQSFSSFESMVSKPTWKDILLELIASNSIDPWNIDLIALADAFIKKVREMERMDFVIQANVILAASILLKYKSEYLKLLSFQSELPQFEEDGAPPPVAEELPQLTIASRIPPRRQITLEELIGEMERIIRYDDAGHIRTPRGAITETMDLELEGYDIEQDMALFLTRVRENSDAEGWSLFSQLTAGTGDMVETVHALLCLLHLVQEGSLDIKQDKMFGEIFIRILKNESLLAQKQEIK